MPARLPGMPLGPGDVFVCTIDDGAPRDAKRVTRTTAAVALPRPDGWIVLARCWRCTARAYCDRHGHAYLDFWAGLGV